jgi:hypothetical protein
VAEMSNVLRELMATLQSEKQPSKSTKKTE